jgi:hypothetical protein
MSKDIDPCRPLEWFRARYSLHRVKKPGNMLDNRLRNAAAMPVMPLYHVHSQGFRDGGRISGVTMGAHTFRNRSYAMPTTPQRTIVRASSSMLFWRPRFRCGRSGDRGHNPAGIREDGAYIDKPRNCHGGHRQRRPSLAEFIEGEPRK